MHKPMRNRVRLLAGLVACAALLPPQAWAQPYPSKPIRVQVGFTAGSGSDIAARFVAQKLSENLGQPSIVENRPGAGGAIAIERVVASPADGYTLLFMPASGAVPPAPSSKMTYDLDRDLAAVSLVLIQPFVLVVHPSVPARNVRELIALAQKQPGKLNYGSNGVGSALQFAGELFNIMARVNIVHVPYKGASESAIATASGQVDLSYPGLGSTLPLMASGKVRALAVTTARRSSLIPAVPSLHESGLTGYDRSGWQGLLAPAAVPREIVVRLNAVIGKAIGTAEAKEWFNAQGFEPQANTPEQFTTFIRNEVAQNVKLIKSAGIKIE